MRKSIAFVRHVVFGLAAFGVFGTNVAAAPIVEYTTTGTLTDSRLFTLGFEFSLSTSYDVTALGYWDDGLGNDHQVGLWTSGGALLASTTVLGTDPITGHFRYHGIGTVTLGPGSYVLGGEFLGNNDPFPADAQGLTSLPGYTWIGDRQLAGGLQFPTVFVGGYGDNGILAANMLVVAAPEPATLFLLGTGLVGLAARRRRETRS